MWNLFSVRLERALVLKQDRCKACVECTIGLKIILESPDTTPGDVGHVESHFGQFRASVSVGVGSVHGLHQTYHRLSYRFERT
jgi:hypothetical protein